MARSEDYDRAKNSVKECPEMRVDKRIIARPGREQQKNKNPRTERRGKRGKGNWMGKWVERRSDAKGRGIQYQ